MERKVETCLKLRERSQMERKISNTEKGLKREREGGEREREREREREERERERERGRERETSNGENSLK